MDIEEMHKLFRVLGQQMGMQQVRAILPASIDTFLNGAILTKVRTLLIENMKIDFESRMVIGRDEIIPINALRTLYTETSPTVTNKQFAIPNNLMILLGVGLTYGSTGPRYGCRLIDNIELENTLNDYCNGAYKEHPIANLYGSNVRLYFGDYNPTTIVPFVKFIKFPAVVKLDENTASSCVDCDLPEYLHHEIVEMAVRTYFSSVGYTTPNNNSANKQ